ncbi:hypothetical protein MKX03_017994 [Papaver bracteatum]|nr:hypothetical protein MKX03_017994 [Papaver bracteatum]
MYGVESKEGAIECMLLTLFFLGTWPAIIALSERKGRLPQHTYLDYSITNLFQRERVNKFTIFVKSMRKGIIGRASCSLWQVGFFSVRVGNLAIQYAWAEVGLSVTEVICSSIEVVISTTLNYFLDDRINKAEILFPGVACFLVAVCLGSALHSSNSTDNKAKLSSYVNERESNNSSNIGENSLTIVDGKKDMEDGTIPSEKAEVGTVGFLIELENNRAIKATNDQWGTMKEGVPHSVIYTAFFHFSVSCFVVAIVLNIIFLSYPVFNLPRSSLKSYVNDWNGRNWALSAGFLCGFGNGLLFMGGQAAGYAVVDRRPFKSFTSTNLLSSNFADDGFSFKLIHSKLRKFYDEICLLGSSNGLVLF